MSYRLILLRHGQSTWNLENRFTGWVDVPLTERGEVEAAESGSLMTAAGVEPAILHTSLLVRAIQSAEIALAAMGRSWIPVRRSWRLNERHYGDLQGLNKAETAAKHGEAQVKLWRRSYDTPPPPLPDGDGTAAGSRPPLCGPVPRRAAIDRVPEGRGGADASVLV